MAMFFEPTSFGGFTGVQSKRYFTLTKPSISQTFIIILGLELVYKHCLDEIRHQAPLR